jgi:uncharacterized glyoxalase superfamily protein PhnB
MVTGLDALFLEVNNLEDSLAFYHQHLGLEIDSHNPENEPPIATLRAGSLKINLVQQVETMLKRGRGVYFVLGVDEVDAVFTHLAASGVVVEPPTDEGWGGRFVSVTDPDGYRLFLVEWNGKS